MGSISDINASKVINGRTCGLPTDLIPLFIIHSLLAAIFAHYQYIVHSSFLGQGYQESLNTSFCSASNTFYDSKELWTVLGLLALINN